jgi:hypothetical protein
MKRETSLCLILLLLTWSTDSLAEQQPANDPTADAVGLFRAMDAGQIDVRFIPLDAADANLLIANKTDRVVHLRLPTTFAAVPVLAQFDQGFGQGQAAGGGGGGNNAPQSVGGGVNAGGNQGFGNQGFGNAGFAGGGGNGGRQGQGFGRGGGFMRIPPQSTRKLTATTVCLEHGKAEPNPRIQYRMIPMADYTADQRVALLCEKLATGEIEQNTAQAAAWHLTGDLSWDKLSRLNRVESKYLGNIRFFTERELKTAKEAVASVTESVSLNTYSAVSSQR